MTGFLSFTHSLHMYTFFSLITSVLICPFAEVFATFRARRHHFFRHAVKAAHMNGQAC